ncbi:Rrf2 family transcriptional regulator [Caldalkalibacillus salinus]|uniref:Rrf2 family transcriptional regulator n=1 Tax=Caldalkalibacillus salinus TaxID=2803787 RepID=UPI001921A767|nr:Rrf2 family transcriptional regulator [Caldalkalibacillus salinus]
MSISSRFAVGIHILTLLEVNKEGVNSSDFIAGSVNTNPALIRKIIGMLKQADLVKVRPGVAGAELAKELDEITLLDVYRAVNVVQDQALFGVHENPNPACPVGRHIQDTIGSLFTTAQKAMEKALGHVTIRDVVQDVLDKEQAQNTEG